MSCKKVLYLAQFRVRLAPKQLSAYFEHQVNGQENGYTELIIKIKKWSSHYIQLHRPVLIFTYIYIKNIYTHTHTAL